VSLRRAEGASRRGRQLVGGCMRGQRALPADFFSPGLSKTEHSLEITD
jgi:hypothetical protein